MTLYRKYRPQTIEDLDLDSVRNTLKKISLNLSDMPHAFLFSGPKGSGKTSAARILAKLANCEHPVVKEDSIEPCNRCSQCKAITDGQSMDVIEMDAASNRGIDDIRSLREHISLSPASAKKKIYILDEAHMLTTEASNAFLKTLEEPPLHVIFILATTDPHKLPETVRSRLTSVNFRKATDIEIARQLDRVVKGEALQIEEGVIKLIAKGADGSFRDAVKALEGLLIFGKKITKKDTENYLFKSGIISEAELAKLLINNDKVQLLKLVGEFSSNGGSVKDLIDRTIGYLRTSLLMSEGIKIDNAEPLNTSGEKIITLIKMFLEARTNLAKTSISQLPLEILIINWCKDNEIKLAKPVKEEVEPEPQDSKKKVKNSSLVVDNNTWAAILGNLKEKNTSIETLLRAAKPTGIDGNIFNVEVYYNFHKERLESAQCRMILEKVVGEVTGINAVKVLCTLTDPPLEMKRKPESLTDVKEDDIIEAAKEIFGG